jgi:hypothetical protein
MNIGFRLEQLRDLLRTFTNNENPRIRHLSRASILMVLAITVSSTVSTLADENAPADPTVQTEPSQPTPEPSPSDTGSAIELIASQPSSSPIPSPEASPTSTQSPSDLPLAEITSEPTSESTPEPTPEPTPSEESPSPSPTPKPKPYPLNPQPQLTLIVPNSLNVDPRATRTFMPRIYLSGTPYALMCIRSSRAIIDIAIRNQNDDFLGEGIKIIGDQSNEVFITGPTSFVQDYVNLQDGIQLTSNYGGLGGSYVRFDLVAMSEPDIDPSYCDYAGAQRWSGLRSLGLTINTIQTKVTLGKKK